MKIALWGYYGTNFGDNIMMDILVNFIQENHYELEIIDTFGNIENILDGRNIKVVNLIQSNRLERLKKIIELSAKDTINIWGGGTIFTDVDGDGNFKPFYLISLLGGNIGYVGVGIGALKNKKRILKTKLLLKKSIFTIFRDENSLKHAKKLCDCNNTYHLAEDLSYAYFSKFKREKNRNEEKDYILITWRNLVGYLTQEEEIKRMEDAINSTKQLCEILNINNIVLLGLDSEMDFESCKLIKNIVEQTSNIECSINYTINYEEQLSIITKAKFHISGRLHGSISSEFFNVPTLSLNYSPKMDYFYKSINRTNYLDIYNDKITFEKMLDVFKIDEIDMTILNKKDRSLKNFSIMKEKIDEVINFGRKV